MKRLLNILLALLFPLVVFAQEVVMVESVKVHFRQGSSTLEVGYMQNEAALKTLSDYLDGYVFDGSRGKARVREYMSAVNFGL